MKSAETTVKNYVVTKRTSPQAKTIHSRISSPKSRQIIYLFLSD